MSRVRALIIIIAMLSSLAGRAVLADHPASMVRAGVGIADATWHVGVGSGQYSAKDPNALGVAGGDVDPHNHSNVQRRSYGVQSRLTYRALVVEGNNGERVALVKSDSYLAQDLLSRRVAQILADGTSGIGYDQILLTASHNHSSPYYFSPSWGVWIFQDVFEMRVFEYHARQMASAIETAAANLRPASIGATTIRHTIYKGNIARPGIADDGTPRGYPETWGGEGGHADFGVTVMRVDDVSGERPEPMAVWVNHGQHPESLDGYDLITADFLAPLERMVERDTGAPLIFSQGDVGSAEGPYFRSGYETLPDGVIRAWAHVGHAQTERGARYLADDIVAAWEDIGEGDDDVVVPMSTDFPVLYASEFVPGPLSHPYPSVSNCRSEPTVEGNPGSPILGLPDCARAQGSNDNASLVWETLKAEGVILPDHYDAPGFAAVEENLRLRLQAFRVGDIVLASCACEAQMELILNFESRADDIEGNMFDGYDWAWACSQNGDTTWTCTQPSTTTFSNERYERMMAQIHNDADGWDAPENVLAANSEPSDPAAIWGNFTKRELDADTGYKLAVGIGHATDYNGYTVSYREYMAYDHYRKALTSYGPHTADYMVTRMVGLAASMNGGPPFEGEPHQAFAEVDEAREIAIAEAIGRASSAAYDAWIGALPDDLGPAEAITQPEDVQRFDAATFTWRGGSNAVDNPRARVERFDDGRWEPFADQSGEVQTMVRFPQGWQGVLDTYTGNQEWLWTANFEAFDAFPASAVPGGQTPDGTYRFVVDGMIRSGGETVPYRIASDAFEVGAWEGVVVRDVQIDDDGDVSFAADFAYPRTYTSSFRYVRDDGSTVLCKTCSFRPWASTGRIVEASVTVTRADSSVNVVPAALQGGRWVAPTALGPGDSAVIARGDVIDAFGEFNGADHPVV